MGSAAVPIIWPHNGPPVAPHLAHHQGPHQAPSSGPHLAHLTPSGLFSIVDTSYVCPTTSRRPPTPYKRSPPTWAPPAAIEVPRSGPPPAPLL